MNTEKLLKDLSSKFNEINFIYFDDQQERLTEAQRNAFPKVVERSLPSLGESLSEASIYIMVTPKGQDKSFRDLVRDFFSRGGKEIFLLVGDTEFPQLRTNDLMLIRPNGATIRRLFPVQCLGKSHCVQISSTHYLNGRYLECAASEYFPLKLTNKTLQSQKIAFEHKILKLKSEVESIKKDFEYLQQAKSDLEIKVRKEEAKKIENLNRKVSLLSSQKEGLKAEMLYYKEKYKSARGSLSFRFGNMFVNATKSPKALLLLPLTLFVFFVKNLKKAVKYRLAKNKKKWAHMSNLGADKKESLSAIDEILPTRVKAENRRLLGDYLVNSIPAGNWVGIVGRADVNKKNSNCEVVELHPNYWEKLVSSNRPDTIIINQTGMNTGLWSSCKDGLAFSYPYHLLELLKYCHLKGIPIEFIDSASSESNDIPKDFLSLKFNAA